MCFHIESATFLFFFDFCLSFDFFTLSRNLSLERFFFSELSTDSTRYFDVHTHLFVCQATHTLRTFDGGGRIHRPDVADL